MASRSSSRLNRNKQVVAELVAKGSLLPHQTDGLAEFMTELELSPINIHHQPRLLEELSQEEALTVASRAIEAARSKAEAIRRAIHG